jgi:hypothetical protein
LLLLRTTAIQSNQPVVETLGKNGNLTSLLPNVVIAPTNNLTTLSKLRKPRHRSYDCLFCERTIYFAHYAGDEAYSGAAGLVVDP